MEPVPFVEYQVEAGGAWGATQGEEKLPNREENSNIKIRLRASSSSAKAPPPASKSLKRKSVSNSTLSPKAKKSRKMDESDFERIAKAIDDSRGSTLTAMKDMLEEANRPIKEQLGNLERATDHISVECDANKKSIEGLKAQMTGLKDSIKEELKSEMRTELGASKDAAHRLNVEKEIDKVAGNIIIHGLKPHTAEDVATLLESLNFPSEVKTGVKRVVPLGRGDNVKSILVELSDPASRNPLLGNIDFKKLPRGVRIERDVPLAFREEYQKFSSEAHKLRKFCDFQTRIIFVGHEMQLKYKEKGLPSKGYVIHKTFSPSPSKFAKKGSTGNKQQGEGAAPSKRITEDMINEAKKSFIITEMSGAGVTDTKEYLGQTLGRGMEKVVDIVVGKNGPIVLFNSQKECAEAAKIIRETGGPKILLFN
jgi:hypothetical protein